MMTMTKYRFINIQNYLKISLRSHLDNKLCGEISKFFRGGGHPNASGFKIKKELLKDYIIDFPNLRKRIKEKLKENNFD